MLETQETIHQWGLDTFGPVKDPFSTVARAYGEFGELLEAVVKSDGSNGALDDIAEEAADVALILHRLASAAGIEAKWDYTDVGPNADLRALLSVVGARLNAMMFTARMIPAEQLSRSALGGDLYWALSALDAICAAVGGSLLSEMDIKMAENRARDWTPAGRAKRRAASILTKSAEAFC